MRPKVGNSIFGTMTDIFPERSGADNILDLHHENLDIAGGHCIKQCVRVVLQCIGGSTGGSEIAPFDLSAGLQYNVGWYTRPGRCSGLWIWGFSFDGGEVI